MRRCYPENSRFRKMLSSYRLKRTTRLYISQEQVLEAEKNQDKKELFVGKYKKKWKRYFLQTEKIAEDIIKKAPEYQERLDLKKVKIDMLFCRFAYGFQPDEYLCFELENKTIEERMVFISDLDRYRYVYQMNDLSDIQIFNNKGETYKKFKKYYKREAIYIVNKRDFEAFQLFVSKYPIFVRKSVFEGRGRSVELVNMLKQTITKKEFFEDMISQGPHILEEVISQNQVFSCLNSSSVNTVRCMTFNIKNQIICPYCFMKIGRAGSFVDNGGAGGILVGIDETTGKLNTSGYDEYNRRYDKHPDSGVNFAGYQLPEWNEMLSICKEMATLTPKVKFIGWDLTYTDEGWIVVEGNGMSQLIGPQIVYKRGMKAEVLNIMNEMDLIVQ